MRTAYIVLGVGLALLVVRTVVSRLAPLRTPGLSLLQKVSPVSLVLATIALGGIAVLNETATMPRFVAAQIALLGIIPLCVIVASACAVSFFEPIMMPWVLILLPVVCDFMPNMSGSRNPLRILLGQVPKSDLGPDALLFILAIFLIPLTVIGCGVHAVSRKVRAGQLSWSAPRGLAWGLPCGAGVMFVLRKQMALDIALRGDYTLFWVILGTVVVVAGLGGLKRNPCAAPCASQPEGPPDGEAPLEGAATDGTKEANVIDNRSGVAATQSAPDRPVAHTGRMVSGATCGLILLCLYAVFMGLVIVQPEPVRHIFRRIPDAVGYALMFGLPILIGIAGLITGIQKNRPGIGVLALLTTPIGFFLALAAENRSGLEAFSQPIFRKRPIGVTVIGSSLIVLSAFRVLTISVPITANNHILHMLSVSLLPADSRGISWMKPLLSLWPFTFFGAMTLEYALIAVTLLIGAFLLRGIGLVRWLYLCWGAFGILGAVTALYFPPGHILIRLLLYVSFTVVLFRKNSSEFFSR